MERPDMVSSVAVNNKRFYNTTQNSINEHRPQFSDDVWTDLKWFLQYEQDLPQKSVEIIFNSLRKSTQKQYLCYIKGYLQFTNSSLRTVTHISLLKYLTHLFETGVGYSCINTAKSAISTMNSILTGQQIGNHPLVSRFMKGVFNEKPSLPKYQILWDPDYILQKLDTDSAKLSLLDLSKKLAFLVTLLSGQRVATIHNIRLTDIHFSSTSLLINISSVVKQSRPGSHQEPLKFSQFVDKPNLCVLKQLKLYLDRTELLRNDNCDKLFITTTQPFRNVTKNTLSNWIKFVLQKNGLSEFTSHSLRGTATSAAYKLNTPIDAIFKSAGWSKESTFTRFYNRPVTVKPKSLDVALLENMSSTS